MNLTYSRLKELIPGFNEIVVPPSELIRVLLRRGIRYTEEDLSKCGYYVRYGQQDHVFVKKGLPRSLFHEVLAHESIHALVHVPSNSIYRKQQQEAEVFSLIARLPLTELNYWLSMLGSLEPDEYHLVKRRWRIYRRWGF